MSSRSAKPSPTSTGSGRPGGPRPPLLPEFVHSLTGQGASKEPRRPTRLFFVRRGRGSAPAKLQMRNSLVIGTEPWRNAAPVAWGPAPMRPGTSNVSDFADTDEEIAHGLATASAYRHSDVREPEPQELQPRPEENCGCGC